jgi:hypothetical protein
MGAVESGELAKFRGEVPRLAVHTYVPGQLGRREAYGAEARRWLELAAGAAPRTTG